MCDVTLRRVDENIVDVEKQQVLHICVCVCVWRGVGVGGFVGIGVGAWALACVALLVQHAKHRHIVISGLSGSTIFFYIF